MRSGCKVLITGIAGFVGSHLSERLHGKTELSGIHIDDNLNNISGLSGLRLFKCDLLDYKSTVEVLEKASPQYIFHLAAQSAPSISVADPGGTLKINIFSTLNLLEAVLKTVPEAVVLNIGSGDEYGNVLPEDLPIKESAEFKPTNPYAVSKVAADMLAFQYWKSRSLKVIRCRPFNHLGPRQSDRFVASAFAKQIAEIEAGLKKEKTLKTGSLEASKDFLDVRDVVRAYEFLMDNGEYGDVYNICSGKAVKIRELLDTLLSFSSEKIEVMQDVSRLRSGDSNIVYGDCSRIKALGWSPEYGLEDGLRALLDFWRGELKRGSREPL